uniref:Uncharacterized protein n=1 Tax=Oryzias sinensis TaxID=183150 RepID=A0A8C8E466_9TELE
MNTITHPLLTIGDASLPIRQKHTALKLELTLGRFDHQEPSGSPTPKRPRGRPKGSKNKTGGKGKKAAAAQSSGGKRRGRPKKEVRVALKTVQQCAKNSGPVLKEH